MGNIHCTQEHKHDRFHWKKQSELYKIPTVRKTQKMSSVRQLSAFDLESSKGIRTVTRHTVQ